MHINPGLVSLIRTALDKFGRVVAEPEGFEPSIQL